MILFLFFPAAIFAILYGLADIIREKYYVGDGPFLNSIKVPSHLIPDTDVHNRIEDINKYFGDLTPKYVPIKQLNTPVQKFEKYKKTIKTKIKPTFLSKEEDLF